MHTSTTLTRRLRLIAATVCVLATAACNSTNPAASSATSATSTRSDAAVAAHDSAPTVKDVGDVCALVTAADLAVFHATEVELQDLQYPEAKGCLRIWSEENGTSDHLRVAIHSPGQMGEGDDDFEDIVKPISGIADGAAGACRNIGASILDCHVQVTVDRRLATVDYTGGTDPDAATSITTMSGIAQRLVKAIKG